MKPTNELRWVECTEPMGEHLVRNVKVLQQRWADDEFPDQKWEWRDVPTVKEQP